MDDIVLVDKPAGWTSFDVVAKIRGGIRATYTAKELKATKRQLKVGHAGTLDPFATGLLVILLGNACSRANEFLKLDKVYEAVVRLGATSTTGDPEGELATVSTTTPSHEEVMAVLKGFTGEIEQVPPAYSAIKIGGKRAYKLAREGKAVEISPRLVTIHSLEMLEYTYPDIRIRAHVSSGTYIRTLAEDIGVKLGTGAYCAELRRIQTGSMNIEDAQSIDEVLAAIQLENGDNNNNHQQ